MTEKGNPLRQMDTQEDTHYVISQIEHLYKEQLNFQAVKLFESFKSVSYNGLKGSQP